MCKGVYAVEHHFKSLIRLIYVTYNSLEINVFKFLFFKLKEIKSSVDAYSKYFMWQQGFQ